jgi:hypothetical protein
LCLFRAELYVCELGVYILKQASMPCVNISWDSSVSQMDIWGLFPGKGSIFLHHHILMALQLTHHPGSYLAGTGGSSPGVMKSRVWSWPFSSIWCWVQNTWSFTFTPPAHLNGTVLRHRHHFTLKHSHQRPETSKLNSTLLNDHCRKFPPQCRDECYNLV